jgi:hypothetical protein
MGAVGDAERLLRIILGQKLAYLDDDDVVLPGFSV